MKTLLIVRHAKTEQAGWGESDFDRKLTRRGEANAAEMAEKIKDKKIKVDLLVSSPAKRAKQTCKVFANYLGFDKKDIQYEPDIYEARATAYHNLVQILPNEKNCIAIFGHNNGISQFAEDLLVSGHIGHMPTGAIVAVSAAVDDWKDFTEHSGKLLFFDYPKGHL